MSDRHLGLADPVCSTNAAGSVPPAGNSAASLDLARSALFVPASRPDRFDKALATGKKGGGAGLARFEGRR